MVDDQTHEIATMAARAALSTVESSWHLAQPMTAPPTPEQAAAAVVTAYLAALVQLRSGTASAPAAATS